MIDDLLQIEVLYDGGKSQNTLVIGPGEGIELFGRHHLDGNGVLFRQLADLADGLAAGITAKKDLIYGPP
jgi:hypothetical protein